MADHEKAHNQTITYSIVIKASPSIVWNVLTNPNLMQQWMAEKEIAIVTDWKIGSPITIHGDWDTAAFENNGAVLKFDPHKMLSYSHLSSLSNLPDEIGNYTIIEFALTPREDETLLTLTLSNFPTESIYKHFAFYWNGTLVLLKDFAERLQI